MKKLSVVAPVYNEFDTVEELVLRTMAVLSKLNDWAGEMVVVDDGSTDGTFEQLRKIALREPRLTVVSFARNFGHQSAVTAGIDYACGDAVVVMDGDLQDPPEVIPALVSQHEAGHDVVYAIRKKRKEGFFKRVAYAGFYRVWRRLSNTVPVPRDAGDFSLMSRRVVDAIRTLPERNRFVRGLRAWVGFSQVGVPYERDARWAGETKYSWRKLIRLAYDGIFSFSYVPITLVTLAGFVSSVLALAGICLVLYFRMTDGPAVPGFAATAIIILFFGGAQLTALGVLGEYIRRIYDEVKQRPHYIVRDVLQSKTRHV